MASMNPNLILQASQGVDVLGSMARGNALARDEMDMQRQNALAGYYRTNADGLLAGDQNALAGLVAAGDPQSAMRIQDHHYQRGRDAKLDQRADQEWQFKLDQQLRAMNAEQLAQQKELYRVGFQAASAAQTPQDWDDTAMQFGVPELVGQFHRKDEILRSLMPMGEYIEQYASPAAAPTTKQVKLADGSEALVQWNPQTQVWDPAPLPTGGTTGSGAPTTKLTENQAKTTLFQTMQNETAPVLGQIESVWDPANLSDAAARSLPIAGNFFKSEQGQAYNAAASAWAEGALRISTGAAATAPEIQRIKETYFAVPGDTPDVVAFKKSMREMYARAINASLGQDVSGQGRLELPDAFARRHTTAPLPAADAASPDTELLRKYGLE